MTVIDRINDLLKEKGISAAKMSKDLGFSSGLFSQWKKGLQKPSASKIDLMSNYFGVSTDYLLGNTESATPAAVLSKNEQELLTMYRELADDQQHTILITIKAMIADNDEQALEKKKDV